MTMSYKVSKNTDQAFFDSLLNLPQLRDQLLVWLKRPIARVTVYKWVKQGMPCHKIRRALYFKPDEVATWLQRAN